MDIQRENLEKQNDAKGKGKVSPGFEDEMDVEDDRQTDDDDEAVVDLKPMPDAGGIDILREKLQAKISLLRRGGLPMDGEAGDKDDLLEERRRQRAAMREKRRKETKERIRREEEMKSKKNKGKEKKHQDAGKVAKVSLEKIVFSLSNWYFKDTASRT